MPCCVQITNGLTGVCCTPGNCPKKVNISIVLKRNQNTNIPLYDLESNNQIIPGLVWTGHQLDSNCAWTSCDLTANSQIGPLNTDGSPSTYYEVTQVVNGVCLDPVMFILDGNLTPAICGTTQNLLDVAVTGALTAGSPICDFIAECVSLSVDLSLDDLLDVDAPAPNSGDIISFDGTEWINVPGSGSACVTFSPTTLDLAQAFATETFLETNVPAAGESVGFFQCVEDSPGFMSSLWYVQQTAGNEKYWTRLDDNGFGWDIRRWGAHPSKPDNQNAINAAIAYAVVVGGSVFIPAGVWPCNNSINPRSGTNLIGTGIGSSVLTFDWWQWFTDFDKRGWIQNYSTLQGQSGTDTDILIKDLTLSGPRDGSALGSGVPTLANAFWIQYTDNVTIESVLIENNAIGGNFSQTNQTTISNVQINGSGRGGLQFWLGQGSNTFINVTNLKGHNVGDDLIGLHGPSNPNVWENTQTGDMAAGSPTITNLTDTSGLSVGDMVIVDGAGPKGAPLDTLIYEIVNATSITLQNTATTAVTGADCLLGITRTSNVNVSNIMLENDPGWSATGGRVALIDGCSNINMTNVSVRGTMGPGIVLTSALNISAHQDVWWSKNVHISNVTIELPSFGVTPGEIGPNEGIRVDGAMDSSITNVSISNAPGEGISLRKVHKFVIDNYDVQNCLTHGIVIDGQTDTTSSEILIGKGVSSDNHLTGLFINQVDWVTVDGGVFNNNGRDTGAGNADRCGIRLGGGLLHQSISNIVATDTRPAGFKTQFRGIYHADLKDEATDGPGQINHFRAVNIDCTGNNNAINFWSAGRTPAVKLGVIE